MKTKLIVLTLATTSLLATSFAFAGPHGGGLKEYDTDGNGFVTSAEFIAGRTADFNNADADKNGSLSLAELLNLETTLQTRRIATAFANVDTDANSIISLAEFTANTLGTSSTYLNNVFNLADKNTDAGLSLAEFTDLQGKEANNGIWEFARLDTNADKALSLDEFTALPTPNQMLPNGGKGGKR